ncbi:hypothetical protein QE152_g23514 [Popillia japonica]|uniref:Uncharacterized protein n=1 Tax=Popillia japonica TaxID=7064 RepID=A0AAW1KHQ8_POPJA
MPHEPLLRPTYDHRSAERCLKSVHTCETNHSKFHKTYQQQHPRRHRPTHYASPPTPAISLTEHNQFF